MSADEFISAGLPRPAAARALELAREAAAAGEAPVGAVAIEVLQLDADGRAIEWRMLAQDRNRILELNDASAHAELLALRAACRAQANERLSRVWLIASLEPCLLCSGAAVLSRVERVYYFAETEKGPGLRNILANFSDGPARINHRPAVYAVEEYRAESAQLLREFFRQKRG